MYLMAILNYTTKISVETTITESKMPLAFGSGSLLSITGETK